MARRAPLNFLGLACAVGVSTIYFNQPLLVDMGRSYGASAARVMFVSGATQVGYALGLLLFVPLGDVLERRALMMRMYAAVIVALLLVSLAPSLGLADRRQRGAGHGRLGDAHRAARLHRTWSRAASAAAPSAL